MDRVNNFLYFAIVTAFIFIGAFFFHSYLLAAVGLTFVVLPVISYIMLRLEKHKIKIVLNKNKFRVKREEAEEFKITIINSGFVPVICCQFTVVFANEYGDETQIRHVESSVPAFGKRIISFPIIPTLCGRVSVVVDDVKIRDLFAFFSADVKNEATFVFDVMPRRKKLEVENKTFENAADESEAMKKDTAGSDIIDVRQYMAGDSLKSIHWKMSAKKDEMFVKERGEAKKDSLVLLFELTRKNMNQTFDVVYSATRQYVLKGQSVKVCWAGSGAEQLDSRVVEKDDELYNLFEKIYTSMRSEAEGHSLAVAKRQLSGGAVLYVDSATGELKVIDL